MNDSLRSVPVSLGSRRVTRNSTGRKIVPHHLIVLKTVIAIACPWRLRDPVPVAVIGPPGGDWTLTNPTYATRGRGVKARAWCPRDGSVRRGAGSDGYLPGPGHRGRTRANRPRPCAPRRPRVRIAGRRPKRATPT